MKLSIAAALLVSFGVVAGAAAQTRTTPMPPPVSAPPVTLPGSSLSPVLTNPGVAQAPYTHAPPAPEAAPAAPINQQKSQAYRNELLSNQRSFEQQGMSPGSEPYRTNQQQLNSLTGSSR